MSVLDTKSLDNQRVIILILCLHSKSDHTTYCLRSTTETPGMSHCIQRTTAATGISQLINQLPKKVFHGKTRGFSLTNSIHLNALRYVKAKETESPIQVTQFWDNHM